MLYLHDYRITFSFFNIENEPFFVIQKLKQQSLWRDKWITISPALSSKNAKHLFDQIIDAETYNLE